MWVTRITRQHQHDFSTYKQAAKPVPEVGLLVLKKLPQLVTGSHQEVGVRVHVDDEVDGLKEHSILGIGVLHFLGFGRLLGLVQDCLQTFCQSCTNTWILCKINNNKFQAYVGYSFNTSISTSVITLLHKNPTPPPPLFYLDNKIIALRDHFIYFNQVKTAM